MLKHLLSWENIGVEEKQLCALKPGILRMKTQAVNNKNNKPAEFLIKGPWWDNSVKSRGPRCITGCPCHHTTSAPAPQKKRKRKELAGTVGQWDVAGFVLWCHTPAFTTGEESWRDDPVLLHGATRGHGLYHVNVGSEPAAGLNTSAFMCGYICVWVCGLCACLCCWLNAECQGNLKPPSFSSCPFPTFFFFAISIICAPPPLTLPSLFLPSGFSEQTPDRRAQTAQSYWSGWCKRVSFYSSKSHSENFSDGFANKDLGADNK